MTDTLPETTEVFVESFADLGLRGAKILFVASTGGHVAQAVRIHDMIKPADGSRFITFESPQTRSLAENYPVQYVPYVAPRDSKGIAKALPTIQRVLRHGNFDAVVSTGAGVALAALPWAPRSMRRIYIESYSRFDGPSLSGRIISHLPRVETYTQHEEWADERWHFAGSIALEAMDAWSDFHMPSDRAPRVFVTLGTIKPYRFDALVDAVAGSLPADAEVTWQLGCTDRTDLPGRAFEMLSPDDFHTAATSADVVISHGGVGTALSLVELGRPVVLIPRRASRNEHVDDHQVQVCRDFSERGLVRYQEADDLQSQDLGFPVAS